MPLVYLMFALYPITEWVLGPFLLLSSLFMFLKRDSNLLEPMSVEKYKDKIRRQNSHKRHKLKIQVVYPSSIFVSSSCRFSI